MKTSSPIFFLDRGLSARVYEISPQTMVTSSQESLCSCRIVSGMLSGCSMVRSTALSSWRLPRDKPSLAPIMTSDVLRGNAKYLIPGCRVPSRGFVVSFICSTRPSRTK